MVCDVSCYSGIWSIYLGDRRLVFIFSWSLCGTEGSGVVGVGKGSGGGG